jgi:hypothetical protein
MRKSSWASSLGNTGVRHTTLLIRHSVEYHFTPIEGGRLTNIDHPFATLPAAPVNIPHSYRRKSV